MSSSLTPQADGSRAEERSNEPARRTLSPPEGNDEASGGGGITAEAADAVILADDPGRLADAIAISRRTVRLARESIWVGLGLSAGAMVVAGFGYIPPTVGALLQEAIDVAVILNALRAARPGPDENSHIAFVTSS